MTLRVMTSYPVCFSVCSCFRKGSVIADFVLLFNLKQERPLDLLLEEVKLHGRLGNFSVDQNSIKTKGKKI